MAPELVHMREERLAFPWAVDVYRYNPGCTLVHDSMLILWHLFVLLQAGSTATVR